MTADEALAASTRDRVVVAALRCLASQGLRRTTVDDIASDAGVSRATLYRAFPGGRDTIMAAVVDAELARLLALVAGAIETAPDLRAALIEGIHAAAMWLSNHEALERLMFDEPAVVLTHVEFEQLDRTLEAMSVAAAPSLALFMSPLAAERAGELASRIVISYLLFPADGVDLEDRAQVAVLVDRHVLPGVVALAADMG